MNKELEKLQKQFNSYIAVFKSRSPNFSIDFGSRWGGLTDREKVFFLKGAIKRYKHQPYSVPPKYPISRRHVPSDHPLSKLKQERANLPRIPIKTLAFNYSEKELQRVLRYKDEE